MKFSVKGVFKTPSPLRGGPGRGRFRRIVLSRCMCAACHAVHASESQVPTRIDDFTLQDYLGAIIR